LLAGRPNIGTEVLFEGKQLLPWDRGFACNKITEKTIYQHLCLRTSVMRKTNERLQPFFVCSSEQAIKFWHSKTLHGSF